VFFYFCKAGWEEPLIGIEGPIGYN
jgi:hypothetical protein